MRFVRNSRGFAIVATMWLAAYFASCQNSGIPNPQQKAIPRGDLSVTAVEGESWLIHLNRPFSETSMGKTGRLGPPAPVPGEGPPPLQPALSPDFTSPTVTLRGSDLYRLNCQGCHGESGEGAPPEINSVINPVRATSVAMVMERMKSRAMDISRGDAAKLAQQARVSLLQRLHQGGQDMPPFPHLHEAEIRVLLAYLDQLAGLPGAEKTQGVVTESRLRVGEHIVKSTCHTCHSGSGPDPAPQQIWDGAIPPLSTLTTRKSQADFIRKVTQGAPILMGTPPMFYRGRMPVFHYLSQEEAASAYLYLTQYPPSDTPSPVTTVVLSSKSPTPAGGPPSSATTGSKPFVPTHRPAEAVQPDDGVDAKTLIPLTAIALFVFGLLAAGVGFTIREFRRLTAHGQHRGLTVTPKPNRRARDATAQLRHVS